MEDAFRVGEYIDTGRLRGTVEGMSLRSVRLRHQNGQVHTIPFGQVQAVTNFSRDWSVVKFNLHLEPMADIETVRRTIKLVGQELLDDTEIGAEFIQPLKMQGVVDVLQTALVVRCKFARHPDAPDLSPAPSAAPLDRGLRRRRNPLCCTKCLGRAVERLRRLTIRLEVPAADLMAHRNNVTNAPH
jgi:small-conductance mechanosensitive channel